MIIHFNEYIMYVLHYQYTGPLIWSLMSPHYVLRYLETTNCQCTSSLCTCRCLPMHAISVYLCLPRYILWQLYTL